MRLGPIFVKDKYGNDIELRNAEVSDAPALIEYLKVTSSETSFLVREPEEIASSISPEDEKSFIQARIDSGRELMLAAFEDGKHIGNCSLASIGSYKRYSHRCSVAIALYQAYCSRGIGKIMMETVLDIAKEIGYEQAELEVMADNKRAISLYEKLGFKRFGRFPNNMKYADGSYDDAYWMMKRL